MDGNRRTRGPDKPLMSKIKSLIRFNGKVNIYDTEVLDWLRYDLSIEITLLEPAELLRYTNIAGKAFRAWSGWRSLAQRLYEYKTITNEALIDTILDNYYKSLKDFIQYEIDQTDINMETDELQTQNFGDSKKPCVSQFTKLVVPITGAANDPGHSKSKKMDFSPPDSSPFSASIPPSLLTLNLNEVSIATILNWWCFSLHVNLSALKLRRETCHGRVEASAGAAYMTRDEPTNLLAKVSNPVLTLPNLLAQTITREYLYKFLQKMMISSETSRYQNLIKIILYFIQRDVLEAPDTINVPGMYIKSMRKYNRCVFKSIFEKSHPFEIDYYQVHLHQTVLPRYKIYIEDITDSPEMIARVKYQFPKSVYIRCDQCRVEFGGPSMVIDVRQHFMFCHQDDGSWQCPDCKKWFKMTTLAEDRWHHTCNAAPGLYELPQVHCNQGIRLNKGNKTQDW